MKGSNLPTVTSSGLRSRKVDFKKGLSVYRHGDLDDFDEVANVARIAQNINTGVEKEEEEVFLVLFTLLNARKEHHLQVALNSNYIGNQHNSAVFIPTPDATRKYQEFTRYYTADFYPPTSYIKFSDQLEDCIGCPYNMDEKDDLFYSKLKESNSKKPRPLLDHAISIATSKSTDSLTQSEMNNSMKSGDLIDINSLAIIENLSENKFEQIMWTMEKAANDKVIYIPIDVKVRYPETVLHWKIFIHFVKFQIDQFCI
jgi:enhancer of polycomb-like protein